MQDPDKRAEAAFWGRPLPEEPEKPEKPEEEIGTITEIIGRYKLGEAFPEGAQQQDYGHALVLGRAFADHYRWAVERGSWMSWSGQVWRPVPSERVAKVAADALRNYYVTELARTKDADEIKWLTGRICETCIFARVVGALSFLKGWEGILTQPEAWDKDPWAFNVANGTLDLRTGSLRPHDAAGLLTKLAPVDYDPGATGPAWDAHLTMFLPNPNIRRQVQRSLGTALVGATLEETLDIWHGSGANGKTTTARALMAVCGDYALRAAPDLLIESKHERHPTEIADLWTSRLVFSVEVAEGKKLAEALVKDLTGGDRKKARFMRQDFFEFEQTFSIVLIVNHKPIVTGTDPAIWRRIRLIPWEYKIGDYPGQQRPQEEVVPELVAEGSAILNWLLAGLKDWQSDHYWLAAEVQAATESYRQEQDALGGFLAECCDFGPRYAASVAKLYTAYGAWCEGTGEEPLGKTRFGKFLRDRGIGQHQVGHKKTRKWAGIRLRSEEEDENHAEQVVLPVE